jgi:hypothetical protein
LISEEENMGLSLTPKKATAGLDLKIISEDLIAHLNWKSSKYVAVKSVHFRGYFWRLHLTVCSTIEWRGSQTYLRPNRNNVSTHPRHGSWKEKIPGRGYQLTGILKQKEDTSAELEVMEVASEEDDSTKRMKTSHEAQEKKAEDSDKQLPRGGSQHDLGPEANPLLRKFRETHRELAIRNRYEAVAQNMATIKALRLLLEHRQGTQSEKFLNTWMERIKAFDDGDIHSAELFDPDMESLFDEDDSEEDEAPVFLVRLYEVPSGTTIEQVAHVALQYGDISKDPVLFPGVNAAEVGFSSAVARDASLKYKGPIASRILSVEPETSLELTASRAKLWCSLPGQARNVSNQELLKCFTNVHPERAFILNQTDSAFAYLYFPTVEAANKCRKEHRWLKVKGETCRLEFALGATRSKNLFTIVLQDLPRPSDILHNGNPARTNEKTVRRLLNKVDVPKEAVKRISVEKNNEGKVIGKARVLIEGRDEARMLLTSLCAVAERIVYATLPAVKSNVK